MTMQRGFGGGEQLKPKENTGNPLLQGTQVFRLSHKQNDGRGDLSANSTTVTLIDDNPLIGYVHYINTWGLKGLPISARDIRIACADPNSAEAAPRQCVLCEAMLRHGDVIKRKFAANLTLIDEKPRTSQRSGKTYYDNRRKLELDWGHYKVFEQIKASAPGGSMVGMRFNVIRPPGDPKKSKTFGDTWLPLDGGACVDLRTKFWQSKAIGPMIERARQRGETLDWEGAVARLTATIDYTKEVDNYSPQLAESLLMFALARNFGGQPAGQPQQHPPAQTMLPGQVPDYSTPQTGFPTQPQQQQQQQYQQPQQAQPPQPPQNPPHVANPAGATAPQATLAPPAMPPAQQTQVMPGNGPIPGMPTANPAPIPPPPPTQQPQQPQQPQAAPQQDYSFDQHHGWSAQMPSQAPVPPPAAAPAPAQQARSTAPPDMPF